MRTLDVLATTDFPGLDDDVRKFCQWPDLSDQTDSCLYFVSGWRARFRRSHNRTGDENHLGRAADHRESRVVEVSSRVKSSLRRRRLAISYCWRSSNLWLTRLCAMMSPRPHQRLFDDYVGDFLGPTILVVHPSLPVNSVRELITLAKVRPGETQLFVRPYGLVTSPLAELFKYMAGVQLVGITYSSTSARMSSLIGGEVQMEFSPVGAVTSHIRSGRLRPLAVTSGQPSTLVPGLPTVAAAGMPGYESVMMTGMLAPAQDA